MKRKIYDLDEKMFILIKEQANSLKVGDGKYTITQLIGSMFILEQDVNSVVGDRQIRLHLCDEEGTVQSTYLFSPEKSVALREFIIDKADELDETLIKAKQANLAYIEKLEEAIIEKTSDEILVDIEKLISEAKEKGDKDVVVYTTKRSDFNDELTTNMGFGVQDLNYTILNVYTTLLTKYKRKVSIVPKNAGNLEVFFMISL